MSGVATVEERYAAAFAAGAKPDPVLTVSEWADQYRMLSTRSSAEPGQWRTERTPYLRAIMDALSAQSPWKRVVFMKGSQVGATEAGNNWLGYIVHKVPSPVMLVMPTTDMAKRNSKQRVDPLFEESDALRRLVSPPRSKDSSNTVLLKEFAGGVLVMVGANSAAGLRSMPARYLFLDEVDAYPADVGGEGDPVALVTARTRTFPRRKIYIVSTPTISGQSRVERLYAESDQCQFWVPCVYCHEMQILRFEQLSWPEEKPEDAVYRCVHCGEAMEDHHKNMMLPRGEWRPSAGGDGETRGFHLSGLYSPVGWLSWGEVAREYVAAGRDQQLLQGFYNTTLGEPYTSEVERVEHDRLYERRENYPMGKVPRGGLILTAGVDVQARRFEVEIVAWGRHRESWSIDYRVIEGDTSQPAVWRKLSDLLDERFPTELGVPVQLARLAVDSAFNTQQVYDWARIIGTTSPVMVIKGDTRAAAMVSAPSPIEVGPMGNRIRYGIRLWPINVSIAKAELYRWLRQAVPNLEEGESYPPGFAHFPQYSKEYFEQLCAEQMVTRVVRGVRRTEWQRIRDRNEALDCRVYARAAFASLRTELWTDQRWEEYEYALTLQKSDAERPARPKPKFQPMQMEDPYLG